MFKREPIIIQSQDYWVKVVEFLQQNWALIEESSEGVVVYFLSDLSKVFDELQFKSIADAEAALLFNRFHRYSESPHLQSFLHCPPPPFIRGSHPNGRIYSSGRYWRTPFRRRRPDPEGS